MIISPTTVITLATMFGKIAEGAASQHSNHGSTVQASQRAANPHRSAGVFGSALERQSHAQQAHAGAAAVAMHRDIFAEMRRDDMSAMLKAPAQTAKGMAA